MTLTLLGTKEFEDEMVMEYTSRPSINLGRGKNEMRLYLQDGHYEIEWEVNFPDDTQEVEHIGLWFDSEGDLIDYDGIVGYLPVQAADLIEQHGYPEGGPKFHVNREEFCHEDDSRDA